MDSTLPTFKVGEASSNIFQENNVATHDDSDLSFVVLAKNVIGTVNLDDQQAILPSVNDISRVGNKLHQVLEENEKLKKTLDESDTVMKQHFDKIESWQNEVMTICRALNQKYMESKQLIDQMKAENKYLRSVVQNQSTKSVSKSEDDAAELSSLNTTTYLSADIEKERSLGENDSLIKVIKTFPIRTRDSSLDSNMMVISLKTDKTTQLPAAETQSVSTENQSVTAFVDTQTSTMKTQCASNAAEVQSTDIHSSLNQSKSLSLADTDKKLHTMLEGNKEVIDQLKASIFPSCISSESDASHKEKENLTQEQESPNKLEKLLPANRFPLHVSNVEPGYRDAESTLPKIFDALHPMSHKILEAHPEMESIKKTVESKLQCASSETELVTTCVQTQTPFTEIQCANTETEAQSTDIATDTSFKTQTFDTVSQFMLAISECFEQIKELEKHTKQFLKDGNLTKYVDAYKEALKTLNNCFSSMRSDCTKQQNIVINLVHLFHTLQLDFSFLINELAIAMTEKEKGNTCDTVVVEKKNAELLEKKTTLLEQKIDIVREKPLVHANLENMMILIKTLKQSQEKLSIERQDFEDMMRGVINHQEQSYAAEKSMLEKKVLLLQEKCTKLTKELDKSNALYTLKEDLLQERESLEELKKLLDDEMKSHQEEHKVLKKENTVLKKMCDILEVDVKNFNTELIECHNTIKKLRRQIAELREVAKSVDVYKYQNKAQEEDILHMLEAERNYLDLIEQMSNKIEKLKETIARLDTNSEKVDK